MRKLAVAFLVFAAGCATAKGGENVFFGPAVDDSAAPDDPAMAATLIRVWGQPIQPHTGCMVAAEPYGGIVRCPNTGHLSWKHIPSIAAALDTRDLLEKKIVAFAAQQHAIVKQADFDCELAAMPGTCRAYVIAGAHSERSDVIGLAQGANDSLVAECASQPGKAKAMRPVCGDVFGAR